MGSNLIFGIKVRRNKCLNNFSSVYLFYLFTDLFLQSKYNFTNTIPFIKTKKTRLVLGFKLIKELEALKPGSAMSQTSSLNNVREICHTERMKDMMSLKRNNITKVLMNCVFHI